MNTPFAAVIGLLALAVIGLELVRGQLDLAAAGERAGIVLIVAVAVDNVVAPVVRLLLPRTGRDPVGREDA